MEMPPSLIESLFERVEAYGKTTLELSKYKVIETMSVVITLLASRFIVFIVMVLFVSFLSFGMALYLGDLLEKPYFGFFIVAAFYLVVGVVLFLSLHKWIKEPISDLLISQLDSDGISLNNREEVKIY